MFFSNYWPITNIQKNNWTTWIQWAENAGYNVGVLPLRQDVIIIFALKFNSSMKNSIQLLPGNGLIPLLKGFIIII